MAGVKETIVKTELSSVPDSILICFENNARFKAFHVCSFCNNSLASITKKPPLAK